MNERPYSCLPLRRATLFAALMAAGVASVTLPARAQVPPPASSAAATPADASAAPSVPPAPPVEEHPVASPTSGAAPAASAAPAGFDSTMFDAPGAASAAATSAAADSPDLQLKFYGDTSFLLRSDQNPLVLQTGPLSGSLQGTPQSWNTFMDPHVDLFFASNFGRLSFLSEVVFEVGMGANDFDIDIERMQLGYLFSNWLRLRVGRGHTAWGYYNDTYHHGSIFELTTGRPYLVQFEDSGGLLSAHIVGAMADGTVRLGHAGDLRYDVEIGNGHVQDITAVANLDGFKNFRQVNVRLRWLPNFLDGLIVGINGETDVVPALSYVQGSVNLRPNDVTEYVAGVHLAYMENHFHILAEGALIHHIEQNTERVWNTWGGFAELGYSFGAFTPYLRWESILFASEGDPVYVAQLWGLRDARDVRDGRVGINWRSSEHLAIKLEGRYLGVGGYTVDTHQESLQVQFAFGF